MAGNGPGAHTAAARVLNGTMVLAALDWVMWKRSGAAEAFAMTFRGPGGGA
jgi:hypothetical protein